MPAKFISSDKLGAWLEELAQSRQVIAPRREGDAIVFRPFAKDRDIPLDRQATAPPKASVFPQCEPLMVYKYAKDPEEPGRVEVQVKETMDSTPRLVFGSRPCDARGFLTFDRVYDSDKAKDLNYLSRRINTAFISLACDTPTNTCFCHWVGSGPADAGGSDVLMTPVAGGYVLEAATEVGQELLDSPLLEDGASRLEEAQAVKDHATQALGEAPDLSQAPERLLKLFDDQDFWDRASAKCLSCGACTYLCPTCYCFNITDEAAGSEGVRLRSWDNCMSHLFTMEASGHNPRPSKAHRLKNRFGHKFSYYPKLHGGAVACCGCGRCIKSCPASVDIREVVQSAIATELATEE